MLQGNSVKQEEASMNIYGGSPLPSVEKLSLNLGDPSSRAFQTTLRWIIFRIVEDNKGITFVQLKKLLRGEFGIDKKYVGPAVSSLTSAALLNGLTKWTNPKMKDIGADIGIHLFVRPSEAGDVFDEWRSRALSEFPELNSFVPPTIKRDR